MLIVPRRKAAATGWTPSQITTALWLDAADSSTVTIVSGAVSQWNDKSGNARHATQSTSSQQPTYSATSLNSKPGITFQKSQQQYLGLANVAAINDPNYSWYIVLAKTVSGTADEIVFSICNSNVAGIHLYPAYIDGNTYAEMGTLGGRAIANTSSTAISPAMFGATGGANVKGYKNGTLFATGATQSTASYSGISGAVGCLSYGGSLGSYSNVTISELLVIPSVQSDANRQTIEGYLAWKWGLVSNLPAGHPYKTAAP